MSGFGGFRRTPGSLILESFTQARDNPLVDIGPGSVQPGLAKCFHPLGDDIDEAVTECNTAEWQVKFRFTPFATGGLGLARIGWQVQPAADGPDGDAGNDSDPELIPYWDDINYGVSLEFTSGITWMTLIVEDTPVSAHQFAFSGYFGKIVLTFLKTKLRVRSYAGNSNTIANSYTTSHTKLVRGALPAIGGLLATSPDNNGAYDYKSIKYLINVGEQPLELRRARRDDDIRRYPSASEQNSIRRAGNYY